MRRGQFILRGPIQAFKPKCRPLSTKNNDLSVAFKTGDDEEVRYRTQKNPAIPSLVNLQKKWTTLDAGQQDDVIAYLEDKMRGTWQSMTLEEKRAAQYVWYGSWGPRGTQGETGNMYSWLAAYFVAAGSGLALYKYCSFDPEEEVPGIQY